MNRSIRAQSNFINAKKLQEHTEISSLSQNVELLTEKNKQKYFSILSSEPSYSVTLYQPKQNLKSQKLFKKQLLLKQLDKLMDQQSIFDKKMTHLKVLKELENQQIDNVVQKEVNPYLSLRTAWSKHQMNSLDFKESDRLESLNFTIGIIKKAVLSMKIKQQNCQSSYLHSSDYFQGQKFEILHQNYERSQMKNQELRQKVYSLSVKLEQKQQNQKKILSQLAEKQKQILLIEKVLQTIEINHKIIVSQLQQKIFQIEKKLEENSIWKLKLEKNQFQSSEGNFKVYLQTLQISERKNTDVKCKATTKRLHEIQEFLAEQHKKAAPLILYNPEEQENNEIIIPILSLTEINQEINMRRKINTERNPNVKKFEFQKYVGKRLVNLKNTKNSLNLTMNDEIAKKFIRKGQVLGTSRQIDHQLSQRIFEKVDLN